MSDQPGRSRLPGRIQPHARLHAKLRTGAGLRRDAPRPTLSAVSDPAPPRSRSPGARRRPVRADDGRELPRRGARRHRGDLRGRRAGAPPTAAATCSPRGSTSSSTSWRASLRRRRRSPSSRRAACSRPCLLERLARFRFRGQVRAVREGTAVFPGEPLVEVTASLLEAQLVETMVLNARPLPHASSPPRPRAASRRRAGARWSTSGCAARTAPTPGSVSPQQLPGGVRLDEQRPRRDRVRDPGVRHDGALLRRGVRRRARRVRGVRPLLPGRDDAPDRHLRHRRRGATCGRGRARRCAPAAASSARVRLDSGDLLELSREVRGVLDDAGLPECEIVASGNLDEHAIAALLDAGAPIDGFGVGQPHQSVGRGDPARRHLQARRGRRPAGDEALPRQADAAREQAGVAHGARTTACSAT